jgi:hypothetical protein
VAFLVKLIQLGEQAAVNACVSLITSGAIALRCPMGHAASRVKHAAGRPNSD